MRSGTYDLERASGQGEVRLAAGQLVPPAGGEGGERRGRASASRRADRPGAPGAQLDRARGAPAARSRRCAGAPSPPGVTMAEKPVGAACSTHRPVSMARSRLDATCWACTWVPVKLDPFVGLRSTSPPLPMASRARSGKNTSQLMTTPKRPTGVSSTGSPRAGDGVAVGEGVGGERLDERPQRHELAEGHPPLLLDAVDHLAVGVEGDRPRCGSRRRPSSSMTPTTSTPPSRRAGRPAPRPRRRRRPGRRRRRRPRATRRGRPGLDERAGVEVALEDVARVGVDGPGALRPAALHDGDVERRRCRCRRGRRGEADDGDDDGGGGAGLASTPARSRAARATATTTVTPPTSSDPPTRAIGASGPATWPTARFDSGTPPKGHRPSTASNSTHAPGRASHRPHHGGVAASAAPSTADRTATAMIQPGRVRSCIQKVVGARKARPASQPRRNRPQAGSRRRPGRAARARRSASGQKPIGGNDAATSSPPPTATPAAERRPQPRPRPCA